VRDSGVGIAAELLPQIFELFVQGNQANTLDRSQGGLGIGLTLVKQLVVLHGGSVSAASDGPGQGSTFTVTLPLLAAVPLAQAVAPAVAGGVCHILLIEDNADSRDMLAVGLAMHGHRINEAENGADGIALAIAQQPDVAIIDIGLPAMSGFEVACALRANPRTRRIRLIALTGYGQDADRERALQAGFDEHMVKPADMDKLLRLLQPGVAPTASPASPAGPAAGSGDASSCAAK
jgi:CheY-like chemotaxis protein